MVNLAANGGAGRQKSQTVPVLKAGRTVAFLQSREPDMSQKAETLQALADRKYKYGFVSDIESEFAPRGLSEDIVRFISGKRTSLPGCWNGGWAPTAAGST